MPTLLFPGQTVTHRIVGAVSGEIPTGEFKTNVKVLQITLIGVRLKYQSIGLGRTLLAVILLS